MPAPSRRPARERPIPPMDHEPGHKDTAFTWAMGDLILARIAEGETVKAITADPRMPAYCTVYRWMQVVPAFGDAVRMVRALLAEEKLALRDACAALRPRRWSGRRSTYTPMIAEAVCERLRQGASLSEVVREPGTPSFKAIYRWLRNEPAFRAAFIEACDFRQAWLDCQIEATALDCTSATFPLARAKVARLEGRRGRLTPKLYRWAPQ